MKIRRIRPVVAAAVFIGLLVGFSPGRAGQNPSGGSGRDADLAAILKNTADYCERLVEAALEITCRETIVEQIYQPFKYFDSPYLGESLRYSLETNRFEYDYQLIRKAGQATERRIPLTSEAGVPPDGAPALQTKRFDYRYIIFGPVGLMSRQGQERYSFRIVGRDSLEKKRMVIVEARPIGPGQAGRPFGKVWIDENDFSVAKIEWNQASLGNFANVEKLAGEMKALPKIQMISEYRVEKNGLRFPSRYSLREQYGVAFGLLTKSTLTAEYTVYRFFTVETSVGPVSPKK